MPTSTRKPSPYERAGSAEINATVARVAPAILELLAADVPRSKAAIVEALAGRHDRQDVVGTVGLLAEIPVPRSRPPLAGRSLQFYGHF